MGSSKKYFSRQWQLSMFLVEHDKPTDFYTGCWQNNRSPLPLLFLRGFLFLGTLAILVSSMVMNANGGYLDKYLIYLTHWGLVMITVTAGMATAVSVWIYFRGFLDSDLKTPLLFKVYWVIHNVGIAIAFLITVFYWTLLSGFSSDESDYTFAPSPVLDVFIHGINSVVAFLILVTSSVPARLLHFYQPLCFGIIYMIFSIIYYYAGGLDPLGNSSIYPMLNWEEPGSTSIVVIGTAVLIIVLFLVQVGISEGRDALGRWWRRLRGDSSSVEL